MKYLGSDHYVLETTGRELNANLGIIGLNPKLEISEGYDGGIEDNWEPFTLEERQEIADYMISLWEAYKKAEPSKKYF